MQARGSVAVPIDSLMKEAIVDSIEKNGIPDSIYKKMPASAIEAMDKYRASRDSIAQLLASDSSANIEISDSTISRLLGVDSLGALAPILDSASVANQDSIAAASGENNFLDDPIYLDFGDSLVYIPASKDVFIHKAGKINYQAMELAADYIKMNTDTKLVDAQGVVTDSMTKERSLVKFVEGATNYDMDSMRYNMDSGKAMIFDVKTQEGEGILYGGKVKKMKDNVIHMHAGRYTTCDAECPHFYLQMTKATVVPGEMTVFGPAYMVFEDVPLYPLTIPFGFFPQKKEQNSGIIIPQLGEEQVKGFYLRDLGYYFAINDYLDLKLTGSIYSLGSWEMKAASNYALRYKFSGNVALAFAENFIGDKGSSDYVHSTGFSVNWTHRQDPKFNPGSSFSASVKFTSNSSFDRYNSNTNLEQAMLGQTSSTIAYSKSWAGTPLSLSVNAAFNQRISDSTVSLSLPTAVFNVTRVSPFKRKNPIGGEKWYEKISFTYKMEFQNRVNNLKQDMMFKDEMWDNLQMGVKHTLPVSASFNIGGVFNITPSFNYNEKWYFKKFEQNWNPDTETIDKDTVNGFYRVYDYSLSMSMNTKLYGTYEVGGKGKKAIFRHVMTPSVSLSYAPDFGAAKYGFWKRVQSDAQGGTKEYSPYTGSIFAPGSSSPTAGLSFGLENTLEAKFPTDKDTTGYKKVKIIEGLSIRSSYNFLADSLKLSPFSVGLRIPITKSYTLNLNATLDPYALDENGRKYNRYMVQDGGLARLTNLSFSAGYTFKSKASPGGGGTSGPPAINNPQNNNAGNRFNDRLVTEDYIEDAMNTGEQLTPMERAYLVAGQYYDFSIPWSLGFNYSFTYANPNGKPTIRQTINFNGSINFTDKWAMSMSAGYDFERGKLTPGTVQITRDLHCWQMSFSWVPVGTFQQWSFTIQAKSSMLSDLLKWDKNNSALDNYYR